jgi:hypothetical protein
MMLALVRILNEAAGYPATQRSNTSLGRGPT